LPAVDKYKPEYYRLDTSSCGRLVLLLLSPYCEMALYGISESLQHSNIELPEETTQLCSSLHVRLRRAIANAVLKRRDNIIAEAKSVIRLPQLTGALRSAPSGESFLFQDSLGGSDQDPKDSRISRTFGTLVSK
jgi:hypothetical protein